MQIEGCEVMRNDFRLPPSCLKDYVDHITSTLAEEIIVDISTLGSLFSEDHKMFSSVSQGNAIQLEFVCSFPDKLN